MAIFITRFIKPVLMAGAVIGLSGCTYAGLGAGYSNGYYGDGYVNGYSGGYGCDPYDPFDAYYSCDYGYGFANIGFGGGWYDNFYYPGYGLYLFDRGGQRYGMKKHHKRYWAHRRHQHGGKHAQRGKRRGYDGVRGRDLTPVQRAERRERRQERRARRSGQSDAGATASTGRPAVRQGNGRNGAARRTRTSRPTMAIQQPQRARPAARAGRPAASRPVRRAPAARQAPRASRPAAPVARAPRPAPRPAKGNGVRRKID